MWGSWSKSGQHSPPDAELRCTPSQLSLSVWMCVCAQSCPILFDPMNRSLPGSSVHGILQARILEWVAISSSKGSSRPRDPTCVSCIFCIGRRILYHWATGEILKQLQRQMGEDLNHKSRGEQSKMIYKPMKRSNSPTSGECKLA